MHIKTNDTVEVLTGDDKGQRGKVLSIDRRVGRLIVEGVNRVYKHVRRSQKNPQGGRLSKEMPVDASNVQIYCPTCKRGVRIGRRYAADGHKIRYCKSCSNELPGKALSKARKAYAQKPQ